MEQDIISVMTDEELSELKAKHTGNEKISTLINSILEARLAEAIEAEKVTQFTDKVNTLFGDLPKPESVNNFIVKYRTVTVYDESQPEVEVTITDDPPVLDGQGKVVKKAVTHKEMRHPSSEVDMWVAEPNHACNLSREAGTPQARKRGITVSKRESPTSASLVLVGHFPSGAKACEYLHLVTAGDSAIRVIRKENYFIEDYDGTDYTLA